MGAPQDKVADYHRNPPYERRVVIFYDVLGWRNHIALAGDDEQQIGHLRRLILQHTRTMALRASLDIRVSTFSDNVVISQPADPVKTPRLIQQMALFQLGSAMVGFLLRGGITIGSIVHDEEAVFGPGLNRAYELESRIANYPRFVLDGDVFNEFGNLGDLPVLEDGIYFLDPFRTRYLRFIRETGRRSSTPEALMQIGLPATGLTPSLTIEPYDDLKKILELLKVQIRSPIPEKEWQKLAWLFDRIAAQLGVPQARSYPRVLPKTGE